MDCQTRYQIQYLYATHTHTENTHATQSTRTTRAHNTHRTHTSLQLMV